MTTEEREKLEHCTGIKTEVWYKVKGSSERYLLGTVEEVVSVIHGESITI